MKHGLATVLLLAAGHFFRHGGRAIGQTEGVEVCIVPIGP